MLLNNKTTAWLQAYTSNPQTALLIDSVGDIETAILIAIDLHEAIVGDAKKPLIKVELGDKKSIGIDDVRGLQRSLSLKADSNSQNEGKITRMALIEHAERLTTEAQSALLKLIEELPARTIIILASADSNALLETIRSRCMNLPVLPITESQAIVFAENHNYDSTDAKRALVLSEGRRTQFLQFLENSEELQLLVSNAKIFVSTSVFGRQKLIDELLKQKGDVHAFLLSLLTLTKAGMRSANDNNSRTRWKNALVEVLRSQELLSRNVSPKLALLDLSINL